jgi:UDP-N-acetylmuramoyl-L-alanyl-D-glutamate--2,6-diaminopimelate ligase
MAERSLSELVRAGFATRVIGDGSARACGIRHDSRAIEPGDIFVAISREAAGAGRDGALFIQDAVARGAVAVLADRELALSVPQLVTGDTLRSLASIARELYGDPTSEMGVVGITGTNGKTTVSYLVESILRSADKRPAVIGTVNVRGPGGERPTLHTTPMADDLMRHARWAVDTGATHLVLEISSHGLAMQRADGVRISVAAFTNLTQDHLDYHGDFASYGAAKRRLFVDLKPERAVINFDDAFGKELARAARCPVLRCSTAGAAEAELRVIDRVFDANGIRARVVTPQGEVLLKSPLVGDHNLDNLLVALGVGIQLSLPLPAITDALAQAKGAPGRLERVGVHGSDGAATKAAALPSNEPSVFVDYAHTPDALERVLRALRPITAGRLWVVFGCGGDRDRGKRPLMGRAAAELADIAIATSDNPRTEQPASILADIEPGLRGGAGELLHADRVGAAKRGYLMIEDRRSAIGLALANAAPGDVVLIAGKGHEKYQIIGARKEAFDDCDEARQALVRRGAVQS